MPSKFSENVVVRSIKAAFIGAFVALVLALVLWGSPAKQTTGGACIPSKDGGGGVLVRDNNSVESGFAADLDGCK